MQTALKYRTQPFWNQFGRGGLPYTPIIWLADEYTGILSQSFKSEMGSLLAFEKLNGLSNGFWKASRAYT